MLQTDKHARARAQWAVRPFVFALAHTHHTHYLNMCDIAERCVLCAHSVHMRARARARKSQLRPNFATAILSQPYAACIYMHKNGHSLTVCARVYINTRARTNTHKVMFKNLICLRVTQSKAMPI
jgi:hypothetical protein